MMNEVSQEVIEEKLRKLIDKVLQSVNRNEEKVSITSDTNIREDLGFDSIMLMVLQVEIEDEFHIHFNPLQDDCRTIFVTIKTISTYIVRRLAEEKYEI